MIRRFQKEDSQQCMRVLLASVETMDGLNQAAREYVINKMSPASMNEEFEPMYALVFEEQGQVLGMGALFKNEITRMYIAPNAQGRGIGSALLQALEEEARRQQIDMLEAHASPSAVGLYEKFGFKSIRNDSYKTGKAIFEFIVMEKPLHYDD